jgi:hypothetical protein
LHFLTQSGTRIAFEYGVNSEMSAGANDSPIAGGYDGAILDGNELRAMRCRLHELANVFTGTMISGGLLSQYLEGGSLQQYATDICECSERGSVLVRELRGQLLAACGEAESSQPRPLEVSNRGECGE